MSFPHRVLVRLGRLACVAASAHTAGAVARPPEAPLPPAAAAVVKARFPQLVVLARDSGPLHGDGAHDIAVVLGSGRNGGRGARIAAVLWAEPGGRYRFADASGDIDGVCPGCEVEVRIREHALEVATSDPGPRVTALRTWRFVYRGTRGNVLRLVGVRSEEIVPGADGPPRDAVASVDLLTGDKHDTGTREVDGRAQRVESHGRVPLRQPILFDQFAFDFRGDQPETRLAFGSGAPDGR